LRSYILRLLKNGPKHGYEIMKLMEKETDWKPSPGAVYPILHQLKKRKLITEIKSKGEKKISYKLTKEGMTLANKIERGKKELKKTIRNFIGTMSQIIEIDESELKSLMKRHRKFRGSEFFLLPHGIRESLIKSRNLIMKIAKDKSKEKRLKKIIKETYKKLEELEGE